MPYSGYGKNTPVELTGMIKGDFIKSKSQIIEVPLNKGDLGGL
jgi:hypothetical protein